jgi:hypothetical protein
MISLGSENSANSAPSENGSDQKQKALSPILTHLMHLFRSAASTV